MKLWDKKRVSVGVGFVLMSIPLFVMAEAVHWSYEGEAGPENWGTLSPDYHLCGDGASQSPIDIPHNSLEALGTLTLQYNSTPLRILNNGHTLQVNYESGSNLVIDGQTYQLIQFHFHTPSEHKAEGVQYPMEVHFVHKNASGQLAVVGAMMMTGTANSTFESILANAPAVEGEVVIDGKTVNGLNILPVSKDEYYNYSGSLTTPPCSEGVKWLVLDKPVAVSDSQINRFKNFFSLNARPIQPLNGRTVVEYDN